MTDDIFDGLRSENKNKSVLKTAWIRIGELKNHHRAQMLMIASKSLIDPITNPEGISLGYFNGSDSFIIAGWNHNPASIDTQIISIHEVTHFIVAYGPY